MSRPAGEHDPALEALARELREACPEPPLSRGFAGRLQERLLLESRWPRLVRRSPLLRLAAGLLVACTLAAPATAVLVLLGRQEAAPVVVFAPPVRQPPGLAPRAVPDSRPEPPPEPLDLLETGWVEARERDNRLAVASLQWRRRFPVTGRAPGGLPADLELPAGARLGLELRHGLRTPPADPVAGSWEVAPADLLWAELERRLARGESGPPPAGLVGRVRELWRQRADAGTRGWLATWMEVLDGPGAGAGYSLPEPGGPAARLFWKAVPWRPHFLPPSRR